MNVYKFDANAYPVANFLLDLSLLSTEIRSKFD